MSFEHGSVDLGIPNPFKVEGALRTLRGVVVSLLGAGALMQVAGLVKNDPVSGWMMAIVGFILLGGGLKATGAGIFQMMRFYVGRGVPTSLAANVSESERSTSHLEQPFVAYDSGLLEQMLMGRKNLTFIEPRGWIARLVHSIFPRLTFLPYALRNTALMLSTAVTKTLVALLCFVLAWFTSATGLGGQGASAMMPVLSAVLLIYLLVVWFKAGAAVTRRLGSRVDAAGTGSLAKVLALAILAPVLLGYLYSYATTHGVSRGLAGFLNSIDIIAAAIMPGLWLLVTSVLLVAATALLVTLLSVRAGRANPVTEVSEYRGNWQESVHPNEIFINIDSMVMANRRYLEIPNRVYRDLEPELNEQSEGKGAFKGKMIQETQPAYKPMPVSGLQKKLRLVGTAVGQLAYGVSALLFYFTFTGAAEVLGQLKAHRIADMAALLGAIGGVLPYLTASIIALVVARLLVNHCHLFWGEMQFESTLVYFKCEGTFTESRISTGAGIYDSTRSENTLVRSSMTPWVIVSRLVSSTFAGVGGRNLEFPRHVLEMHKDEGTLQALLKDLKGFLGDREVIASLKSDKDLAAASNIFNINEQTRSALPGKPDSPDVAGHLTNNADATEQH